jgi:tetratricopeptide (TPR) repeat protein
MAKSTKKASFEQDSKAALETVFTPDAKARLKREMSLTPPGASSDVKPSSASSGKGAKADAPKAAAKPVARKSTSKGRLTVAALEKRMERFMEDVRESEEQQRGLTTDLERELGEVRAGLQGVEASVQTVLEGSEANQRQLRSLSESMAALHAQFDQTVRVLTEKPWEEVNASVQDLFLGLSERIQRLESAPPAARDEQPVGAAPVAVDMAKSDQAEPQASAEHWLEAAKAFWSGRRYSNPQAAIAHLDKAAALEPANAQCFNERGLAKTDAGALRDALADFSRALELAPSMAAAYHNRGLVYMKMNLAEKACRDFQRAASLGDDRAWSRARESGYCGGSVFRKFLSGIID